MLPYEKSTAISMILLDTLRTEVGKEIPNATREEIAHACLNVVGPLLICFLADADEQAAADFLAKVSAGSVRARAESDDADAIAPSSETN